MVTDMKNDYINRRNAVYDELLNLGRKHGEQYTMDCVLIALHRLGWGYTRIKRLYDMAHEISNYYAPSMLPGMEQDIYQERMDNELRSFVEGNEHFYPFKERYPMVRTAGYNKLPKQKG